MLFIEVRRLPGSVNCSQMNRNLINFSVDVKNKILLIVFSAVSAFVFKHALGVYMPYALNLK